MFLEEQRAIEAGRDFRKSFYDMSVMLTRKSSKSVVDSYVSHSQSSFKIPIRSGRSRYKVSRTFCADAIRERPPFGTE